MSKRELYYSQIALLIIGVPILISMPVFYPLYCFIAEVFTVIFFNSAVAEYELLNFIWVILFFLLSVALPALSLWFRKHGGDRAYLMMRKLCNIVMTVFVTLALFLTSMLVFGEPLTIAWQWCENYGEIPFAMLLFLVPIFFVFFLKIRFRVPKYIGNTSLAITVYGIVRFSVALMYDNGTPGALLYILTSVFVTVWLFEQLLRNNDGKLDWFARILLSATSSFGALFCAFLTSIAAVSLAYDTATKGFSWYLLNSLLLSMTVFALFVAFTAKINRVKKNEHTVTV